jgi:hypothetical protein
MSPTLGILRYGEVGREHLMRCSLTVLMEIFAINTIFVAFLEDLLKS